MTLMPNGLYDVWECWLDLSAIEARGRIIAVDLARQEALARCDAENAAAKVKYSYEILHARSAMPAWARTAAEPEYALRG